MQPCGTPEGGHACLPADSLSPKGFGLIMTTFSAAPAQLLMTMESAPARSLPVLAGALFAESRAERKQWLVLALFFCFLYAAALFGFWAPADGGVDQNAYLVGGRLIAQHLSPRFDMPSPYAYVGDMFVRTEAGAYYPKYPLGLPLIYAACFWLFGTAYGSTATFVVSPLCSVAAVFGMFLVARKVVGSFVGILTAMLLACSQVMLALANNPNSHASCLLCVVGGMYFLLSWWQGRPWYVGAAAGFLLGYSCLIRYSEGLLVLPLALVCVYRIRWRLWKSYLYAAIPLMTWALPVALLVTFNKHSLGTWTGYDYSNESAFGAAFTWAKFMLTWELMLRTLHDMGLFFVLPLGVIGLLILFGRSWRMALWALAWAVPGVALYTAYYFSPDRGMAYARFFLTLFPPLLVGVAVCLKTVLLGDQPSRSAYGGPSVPHTLAAGVVVAISASVGLYRAVNGLQEGQPTPMASMLDEYRVRKNLVATGSIVIANVPAGSVLFATSAGFGNSPVNYLQFLRPWDLYSVDAFEQSTRRMNNMINRFAGPPNANPNGPSQDVPSPIQPRQRDYLASLYKNKTSAELFAEEAHVFESAHRAGKRIFLATTPARVAAFKTTLQSHGKFQFINIARWSDQPALDMGGDQFRFGFMMNGRGRGGGGGFGPPGGPGPMGPPGNFNGPNFGLNRRNNPFGPGADVTEWQLIEIKIPPN